MTLHQLPVVIETGNGRILYLDRAAWGAGGPPGHRIPAGRARPVYVGPQRFVGMVGHHTVSIVQDWDGDGIVLGDLEDIARFMRNLMVVRASDLGEEVPYSFVMFPTPDPNTAVLAEGRGIGWTGAHTSGFNSSRYGIAAAGNTSVDPITAGQEAAVRYIGTFLADPANASLMSGHRDHKATACPGSSYYSALDRLQGPYTKEDAAMADIRLLSDLEELPEWARDIIPKFRDEWTTPDGTPLLSNLNRPAEQPLTAEVAMVVMGRAIEMLEARIAAGVGTEGPRGPAGPKGDRGPSGPAGLDGADAAPADLGALTDQVLETLEARLFPNR